MYQLFIGYSFLGVDDNTLFSTFINAKKNADGFDFEEIYINVRQQVFDDLKKYRDIDLDNIQLNITNVKVLCQL